METQAKLIQLAADNLAEYTTLALKFERMRPKVNLLLSQSQRTALIAELTTELAQGGNFGRIIEINRQAAALPFWGLCGLGLLGGFLGYRVGWAVAVAGVSLAIALQRWGWERQSRRLLLSCLEDMETRSNAK